MRALLLVLLVSLLSLPLVEAKVESVQAPPLKVGSTWSYELSREVGGQTQRSTADVAVEAIENVTIGGGSTIPAFRVKTTYFGARTGETETIWYSTVDLAKLRHASVSAQGSSDYTVVAPCHEWKFPMRVGDKWSLSCTLRSGADEFTYTTEWEVLREETQLALPDQGAGSLVARETLPDGSFFLYWFSPGSCSYLQLSGHAPGTSETAVATESSAMMKQSCTPTAQNGTTSPPTASPSAPPTSVTPGVRGPSTGGTPAQGTPVDAASGEDDNETGLKGSQTPGAALGLVVALVVGVALLSRRRVR